MTEPLFPSFSSLAKQVWYWPVIRGVIAVIFGVVALVSPIGTAVALAVIVGIFAVVDGVVEIVDGIRYREYGGAGLRIAIGATTLIFGIVVLVWPGKTTVVLIYLVAIWSILVGIFQFVVSFMLRSIPGSGWGWGVAGGLVSFLFGILVIAQPSAGLTTIIWIIGIYALIIGAILIALGLQIRSLGKRAAELAL